MRFREPPHADNLRPARTTIPLCYEPILIAEADLLQALMRRPLRQRERLELAELHRPHIESGMELNQERLVRGADRP
ncbi:hypothetical protein BH20VER1_BH20VER1_02930 [soil metagenome]